MKRLGDPPHVCLITPGEANPSNFETQRATLLNTIRDAVADGVNLIQIREKALPAKLLFDLVSGAVKTLSRTSALVLINDRPDVAVAAGADGVHLPETSFPPNVARRMFASELVIGVSVHSIESAAAAAGSEADYVFFGPIFETPGKSPAVGTGSLQEVCRTLKSLPVIALGGIDEKNLKSVFAVGASGIAAIRSLNEVEGRKAICDRIKRLDPWVR